MLTSGWDIADPVFLSQWKVSQAENVCEDQLTCSRPASDCPFWPSLIKHPYPILPLPTPQGDEGMSSSASDMALIDSTYIQQMSFIEI